MDAPAPKTPPRHRRRPLGPAGTAVAWTLGGAALASSLAWTVSGAHWYLDLAASAGSQLLLVCALVAVACAALRRRGPLAAALLACALHLVPLATHRAAWWPSPAARPSDPPSPGVVRVLHYNDSSRSDKADVYALMESSGADVLSILCPPVKMQFDVIDGGALEDRYAGKLVRRWKAAPDGVMTEVTAAFLVSRWPVRALDTSAAGPLADRFIAGLVERPDGAFAVLAVHPRSPRTRQRWVEGNLVVEATARLVNELRSTGTPVVVLADLNATPTSWRSRFLASEAGLRRAKPLLDPTGTYPFQVSLDVPADRTPVAARPDSWRAHWPVALAIDDALVSPDIRVAGWTAMRPCAGSDHRPVRVDLVIPASGTVGPNRSGR